MRRLLVVLTALSLALAGAACSDDDAVVDAGNDPDPSGDGGADGGSDPASGDVVISIRSGGGFVPFGLDFASVPTVVQADGTVFTGGAVPEIFPGPALHPVATGTLAADEIADLLDKARQAGLTEGPLDFGQPGVTDMPTTTITLVVDGEQHQHDIYGVGVEEAGFGGGDLGLTDDQLATRRDASDFLQAVSNAVTEAATDLYEPDAYQVLSTPVDASSFEGEPAPNELEWPFSDIALGQAECADIQDADAVHLAELLGQATQITIWRDATGATYQLATRARLPFDDTCP